MQNRPETDFFMAVISDLLPFWKPTRFTFAASSANGQSSRIDVLNLLEHPLFVTGYLASQT